VFSLTYPLADGDRTKAGVSQARALLRQSEEVYEQTRRATERQVRNAYRGVISNISRVQALRAAVISNESALSAAEAGYEVGTRTTVDVLVARRNLFAAQRDYAQARYNFLLNTLQLQHAAGTLDISGLQELDRWLR
jgi:outer membrane protein